MASTLFTHMRCSTALRVLSTAASSRRFRPPSRSDQGVIHAVTRSLSSSAPGRPGADPAPRRRRRRAAGRADAAPETAARQRFLPGDPAGGAPADGAFAPAGSDGAPLDSQEYLALASLSPWVPCPDMVIKRVFEIADASSDDVHADLGCGDGRLNFAAVGGPYHCVQRSWGVDVDENILRRCRERLGRRFVPATAAPDAAGASSEADRLEFLQADLIQVVAQHKERYQQQQQQLQDDKNNNITNTNNGKDTPQPPIQSQEDVITQKLSQSTIVTMYFVDDALRQLQPYLAAVLGGKQNARVITVGYEMKGWEAKWVERVLGLTVFRYDMEDVSNVPPEWEAAGEGGEVAATAWGTDGDHADGDGDGEAAEAVAEYLRRKQEKDLAELDEGLEIHHDKALDDLTQFRHKRRARGATAELDGVREFEAWETEEGGWDFDETEDPQELMKEAERAIAEARGAARGKGLRAGLGNAGKARKKGCGGKGGRKKAEKEGGTAEKATTASTKVEPVVWKYLPKDE